MLVLSRKLGEKIVIGENVVITVVKIDNSQIRIGIEAPIDVPVYREELRGEDGKAPKAKPKLKTEERGISRIRERLGNR